MISDRLGLDLLRTYVAVCRQGSLSRVAVMTGRTQSALSMQMRRLETLLGTQLLQRTGRGVLPTAEGELFLGYANRILALGDEALAGLQQSEMGGSLRIGLAEEVATTALAAALGQLHRDHRQVRLDVTVASSPQLGRSWREADLDVMVVPTSAAPADAVTTWNVEMVWCCARDYPLDPHDPLELVAFAAPCLWRQRMLEALAASGREHRVTFTSQSVTALGAAIENGLGIGSLPPEAVRAHGLRTLGAADGLGAPLTVQYGLYAPDRRTRVIDAAIGILLQAMPAASHA